MSVSFSFLTDQPRMSILVLPSSSIEYFINLFCYLNQIPSVSFQTMGPLSQFSLQHNLCSAVRVRRLWWDQIKKQSGSRSCSTARTQWIQANSILLISHLTLFRVTKQRPLLVSVFLHSSLCNADTETTSMTTNSDIDKDDDR